MLHQLHLNLLPFEKIQAGTKTIEMRLWDDKRQLMTVGDQIIFYKRPDQTESIACIITALHRFPNFTAMCHTLPLDKLGYDGEKLANWLAHHDHGMSAYYSAEEELRYGVVGIEIERML